MPINEEATNCGYTFRMTESAHPSCPNCGTAMRLARTIEQPNEYFQNVWECKPCRVIETVSANENAPRVMR
jgi:predicted RNA-binding Zn-ribbon protein involved in translation (DUF1610 family)